MAPSPSPSPWSIAVKTVGRGQHPAPRDDEDAPISDFTLTVSPDDDLKSLHREIETVTGLKTSDQRLIYRGRIISTGDVQETLHEEQHQQQHEEHCKKEPRIRDIVGLGDGQTIHLVPRVGTTETESSNLSIGQDGETTQASPANDEFLDTDSGTGALNASLLAALFGLSNLNEDDDENDDADENQQSRTRRRRALRMSRYGRSRHRLTSEDLVVADPGSMEPVRQGLMTLHTMIDAQTPPPPAAYFLANRRFYIGQWIDCRDTVNQWLEATIVDIALPESILSDRSPRRRTKQVFGRRQPAVDPPVSADDLDGRLRLLLELDSEHGEREREENDKVQLLLIRYNGWARRWDEWIRSDSERIRPFRTRTPHNGSGHLPVVESPIDDSPSTYIRADEDRLDRAAMLPELVRVLSAFTNELANASSAPVPSPRSTEQSACSPGGNGLLPWAGALNGNHEIQSTDKDLPLQYLRRQKLERVAPLMDRLGRTLVEAAPHVASLAATLPEEKQVASCVPCVRRSAEPSDELAAIRDSNILSLRNSGFFSSLITRRSSARETEPDGPSMDEMENEEMDPDHTDFVNSMVYFHSPHGGERPRSSNDGTAVSLLGAYLAASSLSRLVGDGSTERNDDPNPQNGLGGIGRQMRNGGNNTRGGVGGGIDIHIHAIVTGPRTGPGPVAIMGQPQPSVSVTGVAPSTSSSPTRSRRSAQSRSIIVRGDEANDGIFDELYSERPTPLDPRGDTQGIRTVANGAEGPVLDQRGDSSPVDRWTRSTSFDLSRSRLTPVMRASSPSGVANRLGRRTSRRRRGGVFGRIFRRSTQGRSPADNLDNGASAG